MTKEEFLKMKKELEAYGNKIILITILHTSYFFFFLVST